MWSLVTSPLSEAILIFFFPNASRRLYRLTGADYCQVFHKVNFHTTFFFFFVFFRQLTAKLWPIFPCVPKCFSPQGKAILQLIRSEGYFYKREFLLNDRLAWQNKRTKPLIYAFLVDVSCFINERFYNLTQTCALSLTNRHFCFETNIGRCLSHLEEEFLHFQPVFYYVNITFYFLGSGGLASQVVPFA